MTGEDLRALLDPASPEAPKYWTFETSGVLAAAMKNLATAMHQHADGFPFELSEHDIHVIRSYCKQWIDSPVWDQNPALKTADDAGRYARAELRILRMGADRIADTRQLITWLVLAGRAGMDPL